VLASSNFCADIGTLLHGYQLYAATEGESPNVTAIVTNNVSYFQDFLISGGQSTNVSQVSQREIWAFIFYLY
jgi:hypothetical protein